MVVRRIVIYASAALAVLVLTAPFFIEPVINSRYVKTRVAGVIEKQTGTVLRADQMTFRLSPRPGIRIADIALPLNRTTKLLADAVQMDLALGHLLRGKFVISSVLLEDLDLRVSRDDTAAALTRFETFAFQFPQDHVDSLFALLPENPDHVEVMLKNSQTAYFSSLTGSLWISKSRQTLQFDIRVQNLHLTRDPMARYLAVQNFPLNRFASETARMHLRLDPQTGFSGKITLDRFKILSDRLTEETISGDTLKVDFVYSPDQVSVDLASSVLAYPSGQVSMTFSDSRTRQTTALTFTGTEIDIAQARDATLAIAPDNRVVQHLFDILREGTASDISVGFQSTAWDTLFNPKNMTLTGTARNALVRIPATPLMAADVAGGAKVLNGVLSIDAHQAAVGGTFLHQGHLDIDLLHRPRMTFAGEFDLDADLSEVPETLITLLPDSALAREMARVTQVEGRVAAALELGLASGQKNLSVSVTTGPFSGTGYYDRVPFPISISRGICYFTNDQVRLDKVSGLVGSNRVTGLTARVDLANDNFLDLSMDALDIDLQEIWAQVRSLPPVQTILTPMEHVEGRVAFNRFSFKGPLFQPAQGMWDLSGSGENIRIGFSADTFEIQDLSGLFEVSPTSFSTEDLTARITGLTWLPGPVDPAYADGIVLPLRVEDGRIIRETDQISAFCRLVFDPDVHLSVTLAGTSFRDLKPDRVTLAHLPSTDARILFDWRPEHPLVRFEGKLDTQTLDSLLIKDSPVHQKLASFTDGAPVQIHSDAFSNLHISTGLILLETLISGLSGRDMPPRSAPLLAHNMLHVDTERLIFSHFTFYDLTATVSWEQGETDLQVLSADLCGLDISGQLRFDLNHPDIPAVTDIQILAMDRENIASQLTCFFPSLRLKEGGYSFRADLSGKGPLLTIQNHLNGRISYESENGQIHRMTLLSRLLSVFNLLNLPDLNQEGFRYNSIQVEGTMENGVIDLEKAVIDAENMALFFTGQVHPFENRLDLTCLVAPLKTLDTIIQFIPIINTIMSGRLVAFPAKATGAIDDPVVTPLHPSAVGESLKNMVISILKTPVRLFEGPP